MGIDTPEEKTFTSQQMEQNYFAMLGDDAENDEGVGHPPSPSGQSPSAQRRSGILQRLSPSTRQILAARAARTAALQADGTTPSYRDVLTSLRQSQSGAGPGAAFPMPAAELSADMTGHMDEAPPLRRDAPPERGSFVVDAEIAEEQLDVDPAAAKDNLPDPSNDGNLATQTLQQQVPEGPVNNELLLQVAKQLADMKAVLTPPTVQELRSAFWRMAMSSGLGVESFRACWFAFLSESLRAL